MYVDNATLGRELYLTVIVFSTELYNLKLKSAKGKAREIEESCKPLGNEGSDNTVNALTLIELVPEVENGW